MGDRAPRPGPVDYVNVPVARGRVRACVQHGLYLLHDGEVPLAALLRGPSEHGGMPQIQIEVMASDPEAAAGFLAEIRQAMLRHNAYRGQLLALGSPHGPFGEGGPMVEFLRSRGSSATRSSCWKRCPSGWNATPCVSQSTRRSSRPRAGISSGVCCCTA
jgi:hypothetical protein